MILSSNNPNTPEKAKKDSTTYELNKLLFIRISQSLKLRSIGQNQTKLQRMLKHQTISLDKLNPKLQLIRPVGILKN